MGAPPPNPPAVAAEAAEEKGTEGGEKKAEVPSAGCAATEDSPPGSQADRDAVEAFYREWVPARKENPVILEIDLWKKGMVVEAIVRDYEGEDQGSVILYVITEAKGPGTFRCKCVAIEDAYFLWWMRDSTGHPDPGLWRPVFRPFDPAAGEKESPPVIEVGRYRNPE